MDHEETTLPGVLLITPRRFGDHRGVFAETYSRRAYREIGIDLEFVQDNHSLSTAVGGVRGAAPAPPRGGGGVWGGRGRVRLVRRRRPPRHRRGTPRVRAGLPATSPGTPAIRRGPRRPRHGILPGHDHCQSGRGVVPSGPAQQL